MLDRHWDDLQQRLAGHGVQLSRQATATDFGSGTFGEAPRRPVPPDDEEINFAPSSQPVAAFATPSTSLPQRDSFGFETWA
jgi:hypothetical protein